MLPVAFLVYTLLNRAKDGAAAIYDQIGRFFNWAQMPDSSTGVFFGFDKCTRSALEYTIDVLRANWARGWITDDYDTRSAIFREIASEVSSQTGADPAGIFKWCNWCKVAAQGDSDIYGYFAGGDFTAWDSIKKTVSETVSAKAEALRETVEYGIDYETKAGSAISGLIPVIGILGACYLVKKILD